MKALFSLLLFFVASSSQLLIAQEIDLRSFEQKVYSQNGEDGVIQKIFNCVGTTNHYYVEFGVQDGRECNTRNLRRQGWCGLMMDGGFHNPAISLYREFITAENINDLFAQYEVPDEFDLLSIDIDFNDFYVWHAIADHYRPRVIVIEYNATHLPHEDKIVVYHPKGQWDYTYYYGASILALYNLGKLKGYSLVYANANGVNLFFIRDDVLEASGHHFVHTNDVNAIYRPPTYGRGPNGGHPRDPYNRPFVSSEEILSLSSG